MVKGRQRLADWIKRTGVNQREAARILGLDHTFLNQILKGRRLPALANAIKIERVTGIAAEAWLPTDDGKAEIATAATSGKRRIG